jgi:hypothetical protein
VKNWQKILIPTLITLAIAGIYLFIVWRHRQSPGVVGRQQPEQHLTADDVAVVRMEFPQHFDDLKDLEGKPVWMKNGYSMPYYPYAGGRVEFAKPVGLIPPDQPLEVKKAIKAVAPVSVSDNIDHGTRQALLVFTLPDGNEEFATPVGFVDGAEEHYFSDLLFYYDDPHTIYSNWPKETWAAIDAHQVKPGMSELQTRMAIGMKTHPDGQTEGNRTVDYDVNGKHYSVTYRNNRATSVRAQ